MRFEFARQALIASGLGDENEIAEYLSRLFSLSEGFKAYEDTPSQVFERARRLFDWLWKDNPARYRSQGNFRLNRVIDGQVKGGGVAVGNCLGLTLLYNCLLRNIGIRADALYLEKAFDQSPHLLTSLKTDKIRIDIENILPEGFDYRGHRDEPSRTIWNDRELVADIYHSAGNELFMEGKFQEALANYEKALDLNPRYERAILNRAILLDRINMQEK